MLQDLASALDALLQVGTAIIRFHVGRCVQTPSDEPVTGAQMAELIAIFDRFI